MTTNSPNHNRTTGITTLCTLGTGSLNQSVIEKLTDRGVDFFRINMSHTSVEKLEKDIEIMRKYSDVPICVDSEGAQMRNGPMPEGTVFKDRAKIKILAGREIGSDTQISLWPSIGTNQLSVGDIIAVDFDSVLLLVTTIESDHIEAVVINGGSIGSNKACTFFPQPKLPALSEKDVAAIELSKKLGITNFALSFANSAEDVLEMRALVGSESTIISKIESREGVRNLDEILKVTDAILIDRGDLSRSVPLENIPLLQKLIIKKANSANTPAYVATNLLESMMKNRKPTRAELSDVMNTLIDGANGLVLAAETAIGEQPVAAVDMLMALIERYNRSLNGYTIEGLLDQTSILLPSLHGVETSKGYDPGRFSISSELASGLEVIEVDYETSLDVEQILDRVYSPLTGFMVQTELEGVLDDYRLPEGDVWPLPIILQVDEEKWKNLKHGSSVALKREGFEDVIGILHIRDLYEMDFESVAKRWFGTTDLEHPGVKRLQDAGSFVVGGELERVIFERQEGSQYKLTPEQTKMIFSIKGWTKVVAFHSRNVPHKAHEFVMCEALRKSNADGLFIHPVVGPKKSGDFLPDILLASYDKFIEEAAPGALLSSFATYSRYSGPREAVFTALCRKNFGCTHFIVGRDHTGIGDYYAEDASQKLFIELGDIGIKPVFMNKVSYDSSQEKMVEQSDDAPDNEDAVSISGTKARQLILDGEPLPDWYMRESISFLLKERLSKGEPVFVD